MDEYLGLFGVDIAIKKLRPGAVFSLCNKNITYWECPNNTEPPTWEEIDAQIEADQAKAFSESGSGV
jgi:hypothetical protein|tara:strand:- start:6048 stop:6248 length:201 start_codon:yes stop_codon:yes gene_type:complete